MGWQPPNESFTREDKIIRLHGLYSGAAPVMVADATYKGYAYSWSALPRQTVRGPSARCTYSSFDRSRRTQGEAFDLWPSGGWNVHGGGCGDNRLLPRNSVCDPQFISFEQAYGISV